MSDIVDLEEALTKSGPALFKELFRVYPVADPEDYFKNGQWKNDVMKTDLVLFEAHLRECGAPDPVDLDAVKLPEMPQQQGMPFQMSGAAMALKMGVGPALPLNSPPGAATAGTVGVVEIRLIALFVAKWKLDPVAAKDMLSKLTPARRRYVIQNFSTQNVDTTKELETYIVLCESSGSWDTPSAGTANGAASGTVTAAQVAKAVTVASMKLLITPKAAGVATADPNDRFAHIKNALKRPNLPPTSVWQQNSAKNPRLSVLSPAAGMGVRPAGPGGLVQPSGPPAAKASNNIISSLLSGF